MFASNHYTNWVNSCNALSLMTAQ